jgi:8-oxo-dGTP pyrophosphatase MutT (NUDIX family)
MSFTVLTIATACLLDEAGRTLVVLKRGTSNFMLPGGKIEGAETSMDAVRRELEEELGLTMESSALEPLGHFSSRAANEPGHWVEADVFTGRVTSSVRAQAEIEAVAWIELHAEPDVALAPLLREQVVPALRRRLGAA